MSLIAMSADGNVEDVEGKTITESRGGKSSKLADVDETQLGAARVSVST